jgi:hypothetical protein
LSFLRAFVISLFSCEFLRILANFPVRGGLNEDPPSRRLFAHFHDLTSLPPILLTYICAAPPVSRQISLDELIQGTGRPRRRTVYHLAKLKFNTNRNSRRGLQIQRFLDSVDQMFVSSRSHPKPPIAQRSSCPGHPRGTSRPLFITRLKPT